MRGITRRDRILLLLAVVAAAYQVVAGIAGLNPPATLCFTIGFGVLIVSGLLIFVLGFEILETPYLAAFASVIPLSLAAGLAASFFPDLRGLWLALGAAGFIAVLATRRIPARRVSLAVLIAAHAIAGLVIVFLPLWACVRQAAPWLFALVSLGGAVISGYGVLLSFARSDRPIMPYGRLISYFPVVFLLAAVLFTLGFFGRSAF